MISGPLAAMMLADQGADVVKVENNNGVGDRFRGGPSANELLRDVNGEPRPDDGVHTTGCPGPEPTAAFAFANRGKRSICINSKTEEGKEVLLQLIKRSDVFMQNFRPGVAERMGIGRVPPSPCPPCCPQTPPAQSYSTQLQPSHTAATPASSTV